MWQIVLTVLYKTLDILRKNLNYQGCAVTKPLAHSLQAFFSEGPLEIAPHICDLNLGKALNCVHYYIQYH